MINYRYTVYNLKHLDRNTFNFSYIVYSINFFEGHSFYVQYMYIDVLPFILAGRVFAGFFFFQAFIFFVKNYKKVVFRVANS